MGAPWSEEEARRIRTQHEQSRRELRPPGHRFTPGEIGRIEAAKRRMILAEFLADLASYHQEHREISRLILESYRRYDRRAGLIDAD